MAGGTNHNRVRVKVIITEEPRDQSIRATFRPDDAPRYFFFTGSVRRKGRSKVKFRTAHEAASI